MDEISPWIERLARVGYASIGAVYAIIGMVTLRAAFGSGRSEAGGARDAFNVILQQPFGRILMLVVAAGVFGYAARMPIRNRGACRRFSSHRVLHRQGCMEVPGIRRR